ncbi:MAG: LuxR family transcriptional regulator [Parvularculaceae bacterium]
MRDSLDAFIKESLLIEDTSALKRYFVDLMARWGVDLIAYHYLAEGFKKVPREKGFRISRFPESFIKFYLAKNVFDVDPLMEETRRRSLPFGWEEVEERRTLTPLQKEFFVESRRCGGRWMVVVPVYSRPGDIAYFALGSSHAERSLTKADMLELQAICQQMHLRYNELVGGDHVPKLSRRETQVLELIAQGKSNSVIGDILGVSTNTVDTLVRRCFEKLGVASRVEAALAGVAMGIILP